MRIMQTFLPLFVVYLLLTSNIHPLNLVMGALVSLLVAWLSPPHDLPPFSFRRLPGFFVALARYMWVVTTDVVKGGISTARIVLNPKTLNPGIIAIPSGATSELATALSAHAITLSPGEMVVAIDEDGVMYTHCLNVEDSARMVADAQSLRKNLLSKMVE